MRRPQQAHPRVAPDARRPAVAAAAARGRAAKAPTTSASPDATIRQPRRAGWHPEAVRADRAVLSALLPSVSRTFALSIAHLPDGLRAAVQTAYLLCRLADTVEDQGDLPLAQRAALFALLAQAMDEPRVDLTPLGTLRADGADGALGRAAPAVAREYWRLAPAQRARLRGPVRTMLAGMEEYCARADGRGLLIADLADLERYCYFVAGTVGELLDGLFCAFVGAPGARVTAGDVPAAAPPGAGHPRPMLAWPGGAAIGSTEPAGAVVDARAVPFGIGLQLTNIIVDWEGDRRRGVSYLPRAEAAALGLTARDLATGGRPVLGPLLGLVSERARQHLAAAARYTLSWPLPAGAPVRAFCALPLVLAYGTLAIASTSEDGLRPHLLRPRVQALASLVHAAAADHDQLAGLLAAAADERQLMALLGST